MVCLDLHEAGRRMTRRGDRALGRRVHRACRPLDAHLKSERAWLAQWVGVVSPMEVSDALEALIR